MHVGVDSYLITLLCVCYTCVRCNEIPSRRSRDFVNKNFDIKFITEFEQKLVI